MRIALSILSLLCISLLSGQVYEPPVLKCLEANGSDVNLTWDQPANSSMEFSEYRIKTYEPNGDFSQLIETNNFLIDITHTDPATLVDDEVSLYFVEAVYATSNGEVVVSSDTISSIDLGGTLIPNQAILNWNSPFYSSVEVPDSLLPDLEYQIEMFYDGAWLVIGTRPIGQEEFTYIVDVCHGLDESGIELTFRIRMITDALCGMVSNERSEDFFRDETAPTAPLIETVSVDTANNKATICWYPSPEGDTGGYLIRKLDSLAGTTTGINNTTFQNPASIASVFIEGYTVVAEDTCLHMVGDTILPNRSSNADAIPHFTILPDLKFLKCERSVEVRWNQYESWPLGVSEYIIYGSEIDTPMEQLGVVTPDQDFFLHEDVEVNVDYCYVIKAVASDFRKPSLSAKVCIFTNYPVVPDFTYLANVSVVSDEVVELRAVVDEMASGSSYEFQKLDRFGEEFNTFAIASQAETNADSELIVFDDDAKAGTKIESYRLVGIDSCGVQYAVSDTSQNMLLEVFVDNDNRTNTLTWQHYNQWEGDILEYRIFRQLDGQYTPFPYAVVNSNLNYFIDDLDSQDDFDNNSTACYYVEAAEVNDPYNVNQESRTNEECASQEPLIFVPSAIVINGINQVFRPIGGYFDRGRYLMQIFDRSGTLIFESNDYEIGWDATDSNDFVQEGIYSYRIQFFSGTGREFVRNGFLTVLIADPGG